jgi:hypothetical protein
MLYSVKTMTITYMYTIDFGSSNKLYFLSCDTPIQLEEMLVTPKYPIQDIELPTMSKPKK